MYFPSQSIPFPITIFIIIIIICSIKSQSISEVKIFNKFLTHPSTSTQHLKSITDTYLINPCYLQGYRNDLTKTLGSGSYMHCYTIIHQYLNHLNFTNMLYRHKLGLSSRNNKTYLSIKFEEVYRFINQKRIPLKMLIEDTAIICHMNNEEFKLRYNEVSSYENICFKLVYTICLVQLTKANNKDVIVVFDYPKKSFKDVSRQLKGWISLLVLMYLIVVQYRIDVVDKGYDLYRLYKTNDDIYNERIMIESTCLSLPVLQMLLSNKENYVKFIKEEIGDNKISMKQYILLIKTIIKKYNNIRNEMHTTITIRIKIRLSMAISILIIILLMITSFSFIILLMQIDYDTHYSYGTLIIMISLICSLLSMNEITMIIHLSNDLSYYYSSIMHLTILNQSQKI